MRIGTVRAQRLAVSEFGGFATGAEVRRQRDTLLRQLQRDGAPLCDPSGEAYVLMPYNPIALTRARARARARAIPSPTPTTLPLALALPLPLPLTMR